MSNGWLCCVAMNVDYSDDNDAVWTCPWDACGLVLDSFEDMEDHMAEHRDAGEVALLPLGSSLPPIDPSSGSPQAARPDAY